MNLVHRYLYVFVIFAASCLGVFFISQITLANNLLLEYFTKTYLPTHEQPFSDAVQNEFGVITFLPGKEFEVLLTSSKTKPFYIPTTTAPEYIKKNIEKKIEILQTPTTEEAKIKIEALVTEHNLPIAILNVWRPKTILKIKNLTTTTWQQADTILTSTNHIGNLSFFRDSSWIDDRKITAMKELTVAPGEIATFEFFLDGRGQAETVYDHKYELQVHNTSVYLEKKGAWYWLTRVDPYQP